MEINDIANPRQTVLVTSRAHVKSIFSPDKETKDNVFAVSWHMPVSSDPPLYAIAAGKEHYSTKLIKESKSFVVNFLSIKKEKEVLFCGIHSGEHINKFEDTGLTKEEADQVDCPRIKQALSFIECHVIQEIEAGDHIIFIGKVLNMKEKRRGKRIFQVKDEVFSTIK